MRLTPGAAAQRIFASELPADCRCNFARRAYDGGSDSHTIISLEGPAELIRRLVPATKFVPDVEAIARWREDGGVWNKLPCFAFPLVCTRYRSEFGKIPPFDDPQILRWQGERNLRRIDVLIDGRGKRLVAVLFE